MAIRDDFTAGEVLAAADLNDTFGAKVNYPSGGADGNALIKSGTSAAWGSAGGLVHIATESFSAVSSVSLNGVFTSAYANYRLLITAIIATSRQNLRMRLRLSGTDSSTNNYFTVQSGYYVNGSLFAVATSGVSSFDLGSLDSSDGRYCASYDIHKPQIAEVTSITGGQVGGDNTATMVTQGGGFQSLTGQYDGLTIFPAANTMTGVIRVYGYQNS